ncbi:terminase large subunit [Flammeovirga sp. OC4]|uniref:terminase large subunit n=1 Tax=Flammeovirga sp. OC4 TaxID=1382345 RepID=UPI000693B3A7|nr:terminase TerL endonuclease subunit [Flammeovirga sp. OC4]
MIPQVQSYVDDVLSGKEVVCRYNKLAVERFVRDLEQQEEKGFYFCEKSAKIAIAFASIFRITKGRGAGERIKLQPFQAFILANLFGWKNNDGSRRFKYCYIEMARKQGKTALIVIITFIGLILSGEKAPEIYYTGTTKDQARIAFKEAKLQIKECRELRKRLKNQAHEIINPANGGIAKPLSSDADTLDGLNPYFGVVDEYHAHKTAEVYNVIKSGQGQRESPLLSVITTAGFNKDAPCYELRDVMISILEQEKEDEKYFSMIFTLDEKDDWQDPEAWRKANPCLDITVPFKWIEDEFTSAKNMPSEQVNFKTKNLNIWVDSAKTWIPSEDWKKNNKEINLDDYKNAVWYCGLDLSSTRDITAFSAIADDGSGKLALFTWYFVPESTVYERSKATGIPYDYWSEFHPRFTATDGNVVDHAFVKEKVRSFHESFDVRFTHYDRWQSTQFLDLIEDGLPLEGIGQGYASMSEPTKTFEKMAVAGEIIHDGDKVFSWMLRGVKIKADEAGNIKVVKRQDKHKVDGVVSAIMALAAWMKDPERGQKSDDVGIYTF